MQAIMNKFTTTSSLRWSEYAILLSFMRALRNLSDYYYN